MTNSAARCDKDTDDAPDFGKPRFGTGDPRITSCKSTVQNRKELPMNLGFVVALAFGIGLVAGLRSLTAPAVTAWAAHLHWLSLSSSHLAFMGSAWAVGIFSLGALVEFVLDQLPSTPARTTAVPLSARIIMGSLTGACLGVAGGLPVWMAAVIGAIGSLAGAFGGYHARVGLVRALHAPDFAIAIPEDLVAIGLGLLLVSRF
jgi:uncharacterized membrane protein